MAAIRNNEVRLFSAYDFRTYGTILNNCQYCRSPSSHPSDKANIPEANEYNVEYKKK